MYTVGVRRCRQENRNRTGLRKKIDTNEWREKREKKGGGDNIHMCTCVTVCVSDYTHVLARNLRKCFAVYKESHQAVNSRNR
jgi:hypothetical protein